MVTSKSFSVWGVTTAEILPSYFFLSLQPVTTFPYQRNISFLLFKRLYISHKMCYTTCPSVEHLRYNLGKQFLRSNNSKISRVNSKASLVYSVLWLVGVEFHCRGHEVILCRRKWCAVLPTFRRLFESFCFPDVIFTEHLLLAFRK